MALFKVDLGPPDIRRGWLERREKLWDEIRRKLSSAPGEPVNFSRVPHSVSAAVLRAFVDHLSYRGKHIPVLFTDGSRAPDFPIGMFAMGKGLAPHSERKLRLGLMSFRHPEMDYLVDLYVCRNSEVEKCRTMAEEEAYVYSQTVELLSDDAIADGAEIEIYHTGLEPVVIGFYRGLVEVLKQRAEDGLPRRLVVYPRLLNVRATKERLSRDSIGAKPENYLTDLPWY